MKKINMLWIIAMFLLVMPFSYAVGYINYTSNDHGHQETATAARGAGWQEGVLVYSKANTIWYNVTKFTTGSGTELKIYNNATQALLSTSTFTGTVATPNLTASSNTYYAVVFSDAGGFTTAYNNSANIPAEWPMVLPKLNYVISIYTAAGYPSSQQNALLANIRSITTGDLIWNGTAQLAMLNAYDNSSILYFNVTATNGTTTLTTNTSDGIAEFAYNITGIWTLNVTVPNYYENFKQIIVNMTGIPTVTNYSIQSLFNVSIREKVSNNSLTNFNASLPSYFNSTSNGNLLLITNNASQNITGTKSGYLTATTTAQATSGQISNVNLEFYTHLLNITAKNAFDNATISNLTINISNNIYSYFYNISSLSGNIIVPLINGSYNVKLDVPGYELKEANITLTSSTIYDNYTFYVYFINSILFNFKDEITKGIINNVSLDLMSNIFSGNYSTTNGTLNFFILSPAEYTIRYASLGYTQRFYYTTLNNRQTSQTTTLYLLQNTSATEITINLLEQNNNKLSGALIYAYRYYLATNDYILVEMAKTNTDGQATMHLQTDTEFYQFTVIYNGQIIFLSSKDYIRSATLNFQAIIGPQFGENEYAYTGSVGYVTFDNTTNTFTFFYIADLSTYGCLKIYKDFLRVRTLISSVCGSTITGSLSLNVTPQNESTFWGFGYLYREGNEELKGTISYTYLPDKNLGGNEGLFLMIIVHSILFAIFIFEPSLAILVQIVPPWIFQLMGFVNLEMDIIWIWTSLIIVLTILTWGKLK